MVAPAIEKWSPAQLANDEHVDEDSNEHAEADETSAIPADAANIVEACAHLAHVVGVYQLNLQHPSRSTVAWFAQDARARWSEIMGMDRPIPLPFRALYVVVHGVNVCMLVDQPMAQECGAPAAPAIEEAQP